MNTDNCLSEESLKGDYLHPNATPKYIAVNTHKGIKVLEVSKIVYMESSGRYTIIYLNDGEKLSVCKNLGYYDKLFSKIFFLRVHKSYLVNVAYLLKIEKDQGGQYCLLKDNNIVPISNRRFTYVKQYLHY